LTRLGAPAGAWMADRVLLAHLGPEPPAGGSASETLVESRADQASPVQSAS
jgi:hypothetical protein